MWQNAVHIIFECSQISKNPLSQSRGDESNAEMAMLMATVSLDKMAAGGVYDHIGGGFHRYRCDSTGD